MSGDTIAALVWCHQDPATRLVARVLRFRIMTVVTDMVEQEEIQRNAGPYMKVRIVIIIAAFMLLVALIAYSLFSDPSPPGQAIEIEIPYPAPADAS
ncbi:MAG: hypothetical protein OXC91_04690 [Rhodobacteraceae bacterium]|nr:hypothetical protein [Paracoccaceae bacterium]